MTQKLPHFLTKPIYTHRVLATGLHGAFGLLANDVGDTLAIQKYVGDEIATRVQQFDSQERIESGSGSAMEQRAKAVAQMVLGIDRNDPNWWMRLTAALLSISLPIKIDPEEKSRGNPGQWSWNKCLQLIHDIEVLRARNSGMSERKLVMALRTDKQFKPGWARYRSETLRKKVRELSEWTQLEFMLNPRFASDLPVKLEELRRDTRAVTS